jgi:ABC-type branched-subunit amino acid transport system permease subunit
VHAQDISKSAPDVFFGAVLIAVMILLPSGIVGLARRLPALRR